MVVKVDNKDENVHRFAVRRRERDIDRERRREREREKERGGEREREKRRRYREIESRRRERERESTIKREIHTHHIYELLEKQGQKVVHKNVS